MLQGLLGMGIEVRALQRPRVPYLCISFTDAPEQGDGVKV